MPSSRRPQKFATGVLGGALYLGSLALAPTVESQTPTFQHVTIDASNPSDPHCKALGDIDGDGLLDAVVASSSGDGMFWYEYPDWTQHTIRASGSWTTDMQAGDVDNDGDLDIVIPNGSGLHWYENPLPSGDPRTDTWNDHLVSASGANHHDVELADIDGDGAVDIVTRRKGGGGTTLWRQNNPTNWTEITISSGSGEGIALGDLDGDEDLDVAQNGFWSEQITFTSWTDHTIAGGWTDVGVVIADINDDGANDVVLGPSEGSGRLSWYEAADPVLGPWIEHVIDSAVSYLHTFKAADMDRDGDLDLITAEMHQSSDPDEVSLYLNDDAGLSWSQLVVATTGSHNLRIGDVGDDGDLDIFGANWNDSAANSAIVELWENQSGPLTLDSWRRHIIETDLPWRAVFVDGADVSGDGLPDLVAGGWWYPNPGALDGQWNRTPIGGSLHNMAALWDFDGDGDVDVLGTSGQESGEDFFWGENDGSGQFTIRDITNAATGGDFLQGVAVGQVIAGGDEEVVLSWHNGASGTSMFTVPSDPTLAAWPLASISATTNQEQVALGDLDNDGDVDIHLGEEWLRQNNNGTFSVRPGVAVTGGVPDRVELADVDGDGDLDVVIGVEFGQRLVWGENRNDAAVWVEHLIATDFDYFSVDIADADGDGDIDVVGGAHKGNGEVTVYENLDQGALWDSHVVDAGDSSTIDHHDGTRFVDLDLDGDLDIISVGWSKQSLVIYENLAISKTGGDKTPPSIESVLALGDPTKVDIDFSERLEETGAMDASNFTISPSVTVSAASLGTNGQTVELTTSPLTAGVSYVLTVNDIEDLAGNVIPPDSQSAFTFTAVTPEAGLLAHWPLDEASGTLTADVSGNGHTGSLVNGTTWPSGPGLDFDGIDDYVDVGTLDTPGSALTLAAWIKSDHFANCGSSDCRILSKATDDSEAAHFFMLSTIASGSETRLRFRLKTNGQTKTLIAGSGDLPENDWVHVAAVYDGESMELFVDAVGVGSTAKSGSISTDPTVRAWIGANPPAAEKHPWDGIIEDVRIYDRALSAAEIAALPPPKGSEIFSDGFESGDSSAWSQVVP